MGNVSGIELIEDLFISSSQVFKAVRHDSRSCHKIPGAMKRSLTEVQGQAGCRGIGVQGHRGSGGQRRTEEG